MITIDTHTVVKNLVASGFTEKEAENMLLSFSTKEETKQLEESVVKPSEFKEAINDLRHDIANFKNELKGDIAKLDHKIIEAKSELRVDIAKTKNEILYWMIPFFLTNIGLIAAVLLRILAK
jgi:hypothetical protein